MGVGCGKKTKTRTHEVDPEECHCYLDNRRVDELDASNGRVETEPSLCWVMQHDGVCDILFLPRLKRAECTP